MSTFTYHTVHKYVFFELNVIFFEMLQNPYLEFKNTNIEKLDVNQICIFFTRLTTYTRTIKYFKEIADI